MIRIYKIADTNILINTPFKYRESNFYGDFESNEKKYDVRYDFINVDNPKVFRTHPIYDNGKVKIYLQDNKIYRVSHYGYENSDYGYTVQDENNKNNYKCYIYPNSRKYLKESRKIFDLLGIEKVLNDRDVIMLHSSFIKYKDMGILFTAPSGTGKSTQASQWKKYKNATIINGDRTLLKKSRGLWYAYGLPYAGSSQICLNEKVLLKSIVVLRQGEVNSIEKLNEKDSLKYILSEATINYWDREYFNKSLDNIIKLIKDVPIYKLICKVDEESVDILLNEIEK